jgi:ATP-dependent RNA circularization protein (DNA/RNA ligase family)
MIIKAYLLSQAGVKKMVDTKFIKYRNIPLLDSIPEILDRDIYVFEKLDGGNCQFRKIKGRIRCGNRANFIDNRYFDCGWFLDFKKWANSNYSLYNIPENLIFFGEWLSQHEIKYDEENMNKFYLIDIKNLDNGKFIDYKKTMELVEKLKLEDINILRTLKEGKVKRKELEALMEKSDYYNGPREGLVLKDYDGQLFAKIHSPYYQEILDNRKLLPEERYITERKIRKALFWLRDGKTKFNYTDLVGYLRRNINEEHGILLDKYKINKRIKHIIGKKNLEKFFSFYDKVNKKFNPLDLVL